jgi:hypothetical protein
MEADERKQNRIVSIGLLENTFYLPDRVAFDNLNCNSNLSDRTHLLQR